MEFEPLHYGHVLIGFLLGVMASGFALYVYVFYWPVDRTRDARDLARKRRV